VVFHKRMTDEIVEGKEEEFEFDLDEGCGLLALK
jgi:hypothetical protein